MPKYLTARPPLDATEDRKVRKLAHSMHAPADWIFHAQIVAHSWDGLRTRQIAEALGRHPKPCENGCRRLTSAALKGLGMKPGGGRKPRLTERERSTILDLIHVPPPGKPTYEPAGELPVDDPKGAVEWTLDALTAMARHKGIPVGAAWLNLIEGWWRIFRRKAFAGQSLADDHDIAYVTRVATQHLNRHANPWVWGRPPKPHRVLRRRFVYCL